MTASLRVTATRVGFLTGTLALSMFAAPGIANADPGALKVHANGTAMDSRYNEPKQVCGFYIAGYGATKGQTYTVTFAPQGGSNVAGKATSATDTYTADRNFNKKNTAGDGRTDPFNTNLVDPQLVTGMYKVTATNNADPKDTKTKVFRVVCEPTGGADPTPTPDAGTVGGVDLPEDTDNDTDTDNDGEVGGVDTGNSPTGGVETGGGGTA